MRRSTEGILGALSCVCVLLSANVSAQPVATSSEPLELFSRMMPVFTHPRCANCHGAVDPHAESGPLQDTHDGGIVPVGGTCADSGCHTQTDDSNPETKWQIASPFHNFNGKTAKSLCEMQSDVAEDLNARRPQGYFHHLSDDFLIDLAFVGLSGGASNTAEQPRMSKTAFLKAARAWLDLGAKCGEWAGNITQTETFASNYSFGVPTHNTTVNESATRVVKINRNSGKTTASIEMSGHQVMTMIVRDVGPAGPCTTTMTSYHDWSNAGGGTRGPRPATIRFQIADDGTYVIHFTGGGDETTRSDERGTVVDECASILGPPDPSSIDLEWSPWQFNIRCPLPATGPLAVNRNLGESLDCELYDAERNPRLKGRLKRVVVDHSAAFDAQSWLAVSPIGISRADTGEQLPIEVVTEWDFVLVD